jgi:hypothetical protein
VVNLGPIFSNQKASTLTLKSLVENLTQNIPRVLDDSYIIKRLVSKWTVTEKDHLLDFTPKYLKYMHDAGKRPSMLAKLFGFYSVSFKDQGTGQGYQMDLLVMENLFANQKIIKVRILLNEKKKSYPISFPEI